MKTLLFAMFAAIAITSVGCAAPAEPSDEETAETADALRNTGGGDPDECLAAKYGCYQTCAKSGSSSCYRYCDLVYARCRGLPEPELSLARQ